MLKTPQKALFFSWHPPHFLLFFSILAFFVTFKPVFANQLENHSSPYLALHGKDPVNWMEWGQPALDKAKKENKLLFVSIGYFACHWCHVMQRESYADEGIAKQLNKDFISIKVDRELNPVLDKRLIEFVQVTNGTAGWPLNVFITPEGYPLVGATYMPREHFSSVLDQLSKKWHGERESLSKQAKEMSQTLVGMLEKQERKVTDTSIQQLSDKYITTAMQYADTLQGGFGQQRKFPQIPQLWALLKLNQSQKNKQADKFIQLTLAQMSQQGLHDAVAGGFFRYTTDPDWEIPHFEKMLYTNAMIPLLYFDAADQYKNEDYRKIAIETLHFLQDEMGSRHDAFISSLSAVDSNNVEGGYYLWQQQEIKKVLTEQQLKAANLYWNLSRPNELEAGNLPRQIMHTQELSSRLKISEQQTHDLIHSIKIKLKQHRNKTRKIPKDIKLLAGLNGLTLGAFSRAAKADKSFYITADKLSHFLMRLWDGETLRRSAANAKVGTLYDYAAVSWGLIKWGNVSNNPKIKKVGKDIATKAWQKFYINQTWHENPDGLLPSGVQAVHISDSALISSEALLLEASLLTKDASLKNKVSGVLNQITRSLQTDLYSYGSLLALKRR